MKTLTPSRRWGVASKQDQYWRTVHTKRSTAERSAVRLAKFFRMEFSVYKWPKGEMEVVLVSSHSGV